MKALKTYVLIVSRYFPSYHPRAGQETGFVEKIPTEKRHTIRGNYQLWSKRIDEVNRGEAILSLRYWSGKSYRRNQVEFLKLGKGECGYERIHIWSPKHAKTTETKMYPGEFLIVQLPCISLIGVDQKKFNEIARNDGLSPSDFFNWFKGKSVDPGIIIHFTNFRYA